MSAPEEPREMVCVRREDLAAAFVDGPTWADARDRLLSSAIATTDTHIAVPMEDARALAKWRSVGGYLVGRGDCPALDRIVEQVTPPTPPACPTCGGRSSTDVEAPKIVLGGIHYGYEDDLYGTCSCGETRCHWHDEAPSEPVSDRESET